MIILATYFHCTSTDAKPLHHKCPTGKTREDNTRFYNRALANNGRPGPHKDNMIIYFQLEKEERNKVFQVYMDLAIDELLSKCLKGLTQNPNEALHSKRLGTLQRLDFVY